MSATAVKHGFVRPERSLSSDSIPAETIELGEPIISHFQKSSDPTIEDAGPSRQSAYEGPPTITETSRDDDTKSHPVAAGSPRSPTNAEPSPALFRDQEVSDSPSGMSGLPTERRRSTRSAVIPHPPPVRESSLSARTKEEAPRGPQQVPTDQGKRRSTASTAHDPSPDANALLNLPPPLPFDLRVSSLWVGVPHRGPSS